MLHRNKARIAGLLVALSGAFAAPAVAGTSTSNIAVTATVVNNCAFSTTTGLAFTGYDPVVANATTALNATGVLSVQCTKSDSALTVGLGNGNNAVSSQRNLADTAADKLAYNIYQPASSTPGAACAYTTAWTSTATLALTTPTTGKTANSYNVCGQMPSGQDVPAATTYTDTVVATLTF